MTQEEANQVIKKILGSRAIHEDLKKKLQTRLPVPGKETRHGQAEEIFQEQVAAKGGIALRIRWPDFLVVTPDDRIVLTEVKSIRGNHGKEKVSDDQVLSLALLHHLLKVDVTVEYVNIGDKYDRT